MFGKYIPIDVIHKASLADLTAYTYTAVYASDASEVTINGVDIKVPVGVLIPINIKTISKVSTVYCLGTKTSSLSAPQYL